MTVARGVPGVALVLLSMLAAATAGLPGTALAEPDDAGLHWSDLRPDASVAAPAVAAPPARAAPPQAVAAAPSLNLVPLSDLQPLFASGPLADAKRAFDDGHYPEAVALFDKQARSSTGGLPPEARYIRAEALAKASRFDETSREMLSLADLLPPLRSRCLFSAASALEDLKAFQAAAAVYAQVSTDSPLHRDALLGEARARAALGSTLQLDAAAEVLNPLAGLAPPSSGVGRDIGSEALFSLAQLAERRGRVKQAARRYRELWLDHPLAQLADAAGIQALKLGAPPASAAQLLARAELILAANRNVQAIEALTPLVKQLKLASGKKPASDPLSCEAHFTLAKALKKQRRHTEALVEFGRVLTGCPVAANAEVRMRTLYLAGQSAAVVDPLKAKALFGELVEEFPRSSFADDALFFAADVAAKNLADPKGAERDLETLVQHYPDGDYAQEARFRLFWLARQAGNPKQGASELRQIAATAPVGPPREPEPVRRADYWLAQTEGDAAALAALAGVWPGDYYGDLAAALGGTPAATRSPGSSPSALHAGSLGSEASFRAGLLLLRLGLPSAADEELSSIDRRAISGPKGRAEPLLLLAVALTQANDARTAHAIVKSLLELPGVVDSLGEGEALGAKSPAEAAPETRGQFVRLMFNLAYPRAFRPEIEHWAAAAALPPDLLQGLMREESALDPAALSATGAIGLCQLMPATGKRMARKLGLGDVSVQQLQDPELNIRLGAAYLGDLLKRYGGRQALAVAAYNAGEAAVDRWLAAAPGEALDAFVEDIPIAETRHYVKRVLTSEAVYRSLGIGGSAPAPP